MYTARFVHKFQLEFFTEDLSHYPYAHMYAVDYRKCLSTYLAL